MSTGVNSSDPYANTGNNTLFQLQDTLVTAPVPNGGGIIWNSATNRWESGLIPLIGGATELNDLTDVNQTPPVAQPTGTGTLSYNPSTLNYEYEHLPTSYNTGSGAFTSELQLAIGPPAAVANRIVFYPDLMGVNLSPQVATNLILHYTQMGRNVTLHLDNVKVRDIIRITGTNLNLASSLVALDFRVTAVNPIAGGVDFSVQAVHISPVFFLGDNQFDVAAVSWNHFPYNNAQPSYGTLSYHPDDLSIDPVAYNYYGTILVSGSMTNGTWVPMPNSLEIGLNSIQSGNNGSILLPSNEVIQITEFGAYTFRLAVTGFCPGAADRKMEFRIASSADNTTWDSATDNVVNNFGNKTIISRYNITNVAEAEGTSNLEYTSAVIAPRYFRVEMRLNDPNLPEPAAYLMRICRLSIRKGESP